MSRFLLTVALILGLAAMAAAQTSTPTATPTRTPVPTAHAAWEIRPVEPFRAVQARVTVPITGTTALTDQPRRGLSAVLVGGVVYSAGSGLLTIKDETATLAEIALPSGATTAALPFTLEAPLVGRAGEALLATTTGTATATILYGYAAR